MGDPSSRTSAGYGDSGGAKFVFAYYLTDHGPEHATSAREVVRQLLDLGHEVHVVTASGFHLSAEVDTTRMKVRMVPDFVIECIARQTSDLQEDVEGVLNTEARWLKSIDAQLMMTKPWAPDSDSDATAKTPMDFTGDASSFVYSEQVRGRQTTTSPKPPAKRSRANSVPSSRTPAREGYERSSNNTSDHRRSSSSPPSPDRARAHHLPTPIAVFWDIENCQIPHNSNAQEISRNIREALKTFDTTSDSSMPIQAFGYASRGVRRQLEASGVYHTNITIKKKDAADKLIWAEMLQFATKHSPPACIMLISGDSDFIPLVTFLRSHLKYTVIMVLPSESVTAENLITAGSMAWDWRCLAEGKGISDRTKGISHRTTPDGLDALRADMVELFNSNGGYIPLDEVHEKYADFFGKAIRLTEHNSPSMALLFGKLGKPFHVMSESLICMEADPSENRATQLLDAISGDKFVENRGDPRAGKDLHVKKSLEKEKEE